MDLGRRSEKSGSASNGSSDAIGMDGSGAGSASEELRSVGNSATADENSGINGGGDDVATKIASLGALLNGGAAIGAEKAMAESLEELALQDVASRSKLGGAENVGGLDKTVESGGITCDVDRVVDPDRSPVSNGSGVGSRSPGRFESPTGDSGVSLATKGYGLKKWRRIKRDPAKDGAGVVDPNRALKRGLSAAEPPKKQDLFVESRQKSESSGSITSLNSAGNNLVFSALPLGNSDLESRLAVGTAFVIGRDSENSKDRSSKSSTAASAPKLRLEMPMGVGSTKDKGKAKSASGRSSGSSAQKSLQCKGKLDGSKKPRGERVRIEKENSYSSVESDLRSSNAIPVEVAGFVQTKNGRQTEDSSNDDGENSDEMQLSALQSRNGARADTYEESREEAEVVSRYGTGDSMLGLEKNEEGETQGPPAHLDPLAESVFLLLTAQEALEKELKKFGEIGKETVSVPDSSSFDVSSSAVPAEEIEESNSAPRAVEFTKLREKVSYLEHELAASLATIEVKELQISKLQSLLNTTESLKGSRGNPASSQVLSKEMETELEDMLKRKFEAEVEYLVLVQHTRTLKIMARDGTALSERQQSLAENQEQVAMKLRDAEEKATMLRRLAEELEASTRELLETKDVLKMQNDVCKSTLCCFTQLIMLCIAFVIFILQLLPLSPGVVPT